MSRNVDFVVRTLVWTGVIAMLAGLIVFFIFLGTAANCGSDNLAEATSCQNGNSGLHVGFGMVAIGAFLILCGTIAAVRRTARNSKG
jgi:hypothetical protein